MKAIITMISASVILLCASALALSRQTRRTEK